MTSVPATPPVTSLTIRPWPDPVIDVVGHEPCSSYVETYWVGVLGPTAAWVLRRIAAGLDSHPEGYVLDLPETARSIGLSENCGRHSPFTRSFARLVQFDLAQPLGERILAVRRKVPPLTRRQLLRLPASLQASHEALQAESLRTPNVEHLRRRARQLALSLLELGEDMQSGERQLLRWNFHPALAREAAAWAWERHSSASADEGTTRLEVVPGGDAA